ncbi:MAG: Cobalamin import ATP-binding protein BtuD [Candidatus Methanofastidiosum methylothiophilum]|jgi:energy-coupling factor transport system ATP-binding protein|uniref:Cobalamin import ATP-binding protein BtuD n=1 Tax=Candidatus Methanofastidiosum methylothiophilum TaxID=1705564 RepID=A0A150IPG4_9EURY|nr:MAG: Cobalamin import ATP-binding protein BtuD [Candidatus Methanofastidiosum methylthiophilus]NMC77039.1 ATP-binding cassette domain-containing protein [Candidatus Methanofastidiosa archaeon]
MNAIEIFDLHFSYPECDEILKGVNLTVKKGQFLSLVGQNGSGKTTLAKHLNGLLRPTRGKVLILGEDTKKFSIAELSKKVGHLFQNPENQIFEETVFNEIAFGPRNLQLPEDEIVARVDKVLKTTRLSKYRDAHPLSLSGGEKQRLALASVVVMEPEILVLDEPTTGLDLLSIQGILEIVKELHKRNVTVLLITHDMELVSELSERVVVMGNGQIIGDGTPKEIFANDELLARASLEPPQIMKFSKILGLNPEVKVDALYKRIIETL